MSGHKIIQQLKFFLTSKDRIAVQQKIIEMQIRETDQRLFKSTMEDDLAFQIHHLTRKSVLEGIAKMLIKVKEQNDKKIEELSQSDTEADSSFDQSMDTSILDSSISQPDWTLNLNLKMDKLAGPMTNMFSSCRSI